jgi:hypothetical protein
MGRSVTGPRIGIIGVTKDLEYHCSSLIFSATVQKSQAEIDAVEVLQLSLQDVFQQTAIDCATKMIKHWNSPSETDAEGRGFFRHSGEPIIAAAIRNWREQSVQRVNAGFDELVRAGLMQSSSRVARDRAAELAWEAIDQAFGWEDNRHKTRRFAAWLLDSQAIDHRNEPLGFDVPLRFSDCAALNKAPAAQLSCDFRRTFEMRLKLLVLGARPSQNRSMPSTGDSAAENKLESAAPSLAQPWYFTEDLRVRKAAINIPARGKLVAEIKGELRRYPREVNELRVNPAAVAKKWPRCVAFDIYARATPGKRRIFGACISDAKHEELAYELAADAAGKSVASMRKAWSLYNRSPLKRG